MDELRKNHNVIIETEEKVKIEAGVYDFSFDRVLAEVNGEFLAQASRIKELDELTVSVETQFGTKKMTSCVTSPLNSKNRLLFENNPAYIVIAKREFSRINVSINFAITKDNKKYDATSIDISGDGIAFKCEDAELKQDDNIVIELTLDDEEKTEITTKASVIWATSESAAAAFVNINPEFQDKIVKYVFKQSTKN